MTEKNIKLAVQKALEPIIQEALHPENYDNLGIKLPKYARRWREPMEPRHRLATRLILLTALKGVEISLMKTITEDTEALEDAKKHKEPSSHGEPMPKL